MNSGFKNQEEYVDPTAGQAIAQVIKEEKKYRPLVYICLPFSSDPVGNTEKAKRYSRYAVDKGARKELDKAKGERPVSQKMFWTI